MSNFDILNEGEAIEEIRRYILSKEPQDFINWGAWYVGITNDPEKRLYDEHKAMIGQNIVVVVESDAVARRVEEIFIKRFKTAGNPGGGEQPRFVYAFKMLASTNPSIK